MLSTGSTSSSGTGGPNGFDAEQPAQRRARLALVVDQLRVFLEDLVLAGSRRVLQLEHRVGIEQVQLAVAAPLVFAAALQFVRRAAGRYARA